METPESVRTSLQKCKSVPPTYFKDHYFHIPTKPTVQEIPAFSLLQSQSCQFNALPLGLSPALMEFTVVVKEVDWLVSHVYKTCLQHTQTLVSLFQELGWIVNMEKSELEGKQIFDFVGYKYNLRKGRVRTILERW